MDEIIDAISKTFDANQNQLDLALSYFDQISDENFGHFVTNLVEIICLRDTTLRNTSIVPFKLQACLQLKNVIQRKRECWVHFDHNLREQIKASLISCFSLTHVRSIGLAQVVHVVAEVELHTNSWPQLIPSLLQLAADPNDVGGVAVQTLGYICQSVQPDVLEAHNNQILTVLVHVIRREDTSIERKLLGLSALQSSLTFAALNFARQNERNYLMQVICECTESAHMEIRLASLQCLCTIVSLYYILMEDYLAPAIWPIAMSALASSPCSATTTTSCHDPSLLVLQGLELINSVCDAEVKLVNDGDEGTGWIEPVLPQLLTSVTQAFMEAGPTIPLDWSVGQATQVTLRLLCLATGDAVLHHVLPGILSNLEHSDAMVQSCVLTCTAAVLEGTQQQSLLPLIRAFLDSTPVTIFSQSAKVRYHSSVVVCQLCLHHHTYLHNLNTIPLILDIIHKSLHQALDQNSMEQCCWALRYLVEHLGEKLENMIVSEFLPLAETLHQVAINPLIQGSSLEKVSYECLISWLYLCPAECGPHLQTLLPVLIHTIQCLPNQSPALVYTVSALAATISKVPESFLQDQCQLVFSVVCQSLRYKGGGAEEEMVVALARLMERVPHQFLTSPVIQHLISILLGKISPELDSPANLTVAFTGFISDVYRISCDLQYTPGLDHSHVTRCLLTLCQMNTCDESVRAVSLGTVSDIILCIECHAAANLLAPTLQVLANIVQHHQTSSSAAGRLSHEGVKAVIETYSTLIQVFHPIDEFREPFAKSDLERLCMFVEGIDSATRAHDDVLSVLCGLIGDIHKYLPEADLDEFSTCLQSILHQGSQSRETKIRRIARWARDQIQTVSSCTVLKKARVETDKNGMEEEEATASSSFRVSLSCSSSQFITQNIEESFTVNLGSKLKNSGTSSNNFQADVNCNYVEATICIPSAKTQPADATADTTPFNDVRQLRKLGKRRAVLFEENLDGKKLRDDSDDMDENYFI